MEKRENILQSLDSIQKAVAPTHFYARLQARMEKEEKEEHNTLFLLKPSFITASLLLFVILNITVLWNRNNRSQDSFKINSTNGIENFVNEYNLSGTAILYQQ